VLALMAASAPAPASETVWLDELDVTRTLCGWGAPQRNTTIDGDPLTIGGKRYERGLGTHAESMLRIELHKGSALFTAAVGVDDVVDPDSDEPSPASVEFQVIGDGRILWRSGVMTATDAAKKLAVDVTGIETLWLVVTDGGDGIACDHADWADAKFEVTGKHPEVTMDNLTKPYILTPKPPRTPRINGPKVFGVRPGSPFLFTIPATGDRPMRFAARGLPEGLELDEKTGRITGTLAAKAEHTVTLIAENARGKTERALKIVVGDAICLTPPMGWNDWNCWGQAVDDAKIRAAAKAMAETGLINHGWTYINIDDAWQGQRGGKFNAIQGNEKFPDMDALCDYVHGLGLKIGIYSTPWVSSYAGHVGGSSNNEDGSWTRETAGHGLGKYSFADNDARQWAAWGIDYMKYDWNPNDLPHVEEMALALRKSGRDIVYSLSNSAPFDQAKHWAELANCWRTTGDIHDTWGSVSGIGFDQDKWAPFAGPGHWNDPDMLVVGKLGWGPELHPTHLSPDEQYAHISLWCLLSAPLLLGCDLSDLDEFTLNLLTNDEVLEVDQDAAGKQATRVKLDGDTEVWAKDMEDGSKAVGLFNRSLFDAEVSVDWQTLGINGPRRVRDLWRQQDLGSFDDSFKADVRPHGVVLVRILPVSDE
jgi:alpha-galactosidase